MITYKVLGPYASIYAKTNLCCEVNPILRCSNCDYPWCKDHVLEVELYPERIKKDPYILTHCPHCNVRGK